MSRPLPPLDSQPAVPDRSSAPELAPVSTQEPVPKAPESPLASQLPDWDLLPPTSFVRRRRTP
jgi:hypothetical protein